MNEIVENTGLTKGNTQNIVDAIMGTITDALEDGEKVMLAGFGVFDVAQRKAREGRDPRTGEKIQIPAKRVPKTIFPPIQELKQG